MSGVEVHDGDLSHLLSEESGWLTGFGIRQFRPDGIAVGKTVFQSGNDFRVALASVVAVTAIVIAALMAFGIERKGVKLSFTEGPE